jgi:acylphosphatase
MSILLYLKIFGKVQGVFFRESTRAEALELGLAGFVANCSDGTVEIFASGDRESLQTLLNWSKTGPPRARVSRVEIQWLDLSQLSPEDEFDLHVPFFVKRT